MDNQGFARPNAQSGANIQTPQESARTWRLTEINEL